MALTAPRFDDVELMLMASRRGIGTGGTMELLLSSPCAEADEEEARTKSSSTAAAGAAMQRRRMAFGCGVGRKEGGREGTRKKIKIWGVILGVGLSRQRQLFAVSFLLRFKPPPSLPPGSIHREGLDQRERMESLEEHLFLCVTKGPQGAL